MNINTLIEAIPSVNSWIDNYIAKHTASRISLSDTNSPRLPNYFSRELLENTFFVLVPKIETPPLPKMDLGELNLFENGDYAGITYKDTFFATSLNESLHFHEMIHIIQWNELGAEKFLFAYGVGLALHGYRNSPLEQIAYSMQARFDRGEHIEDLEKIVRSHSQDTIKALH